MTRWGTVFSRLRNPGGDATGRAAGGEGQAEETPVLVDQRHGLLLIRCSAQAAPGPDDVAGLARSLAAAGDGTSTATVVIGAEGEVPAALWRRLAGTLDALRAQGTTTVRLVLSGAGSGTPEQPALAQQIADSWQLSVIAPEGPAVIVPGGSLFAPRQPAAPRGWRLFTPGGEPEPRGHRYPPPAWQEAFGRLPDTTATGCVVEQIPAGVLVRSPRARPPRPGDLCYAAPADPSHPLIVVGVPGPADTADIPSDDLSALIAALPAAIRGTVRLAPGDHKDLLPAAQDVADSLGIEVELLTGLPLIDDGPPEDTGPARPALVGRDAGLTWRPFVEAVVCRPSADDTRPTPEPRLLRWRPPVPAFGDGRRRTVPLADAWQATVVRAGLHLGREGQAPPVHARPVAADHLAIELGVPGEPLDDSVFPALSRLLFDLDPALREYITVQALGRPSDGGRRLRRLAVQHGVRLLPPTAPAVRPVPQVRTAMTVGSTAADETPTAVPEAGVAEAATASAPTGVPAFAETGVPGPSAGAPTATVPTAVAPATMAPATAEEPTAAPAPGGHPAPESEAHPTPGTGPSTRASTGPNAGPNTEAHPTPGTASAGLPAEYRDAVSRIVRAAEAAEHDTAAELAEALERRVFTAHGAYAAASLEMRRLRAHVARLGGRHGLAAHLYQDVALRLLTTRGAADPEARRAASNADACWRAVPDPAEARRLAPAIITLHGRLSGDAARRLRASAERHLARLSAAGAPATAATAATAASEAAPAAADRSPYRLPGTESGGPAGASHAEATA